MLRCDQFFNRSLVANTLRFWQMALPIMLVAALWNDKSFYLILIEWWQGASQDEVRMVVMSASVFSFMGGWALTIVNFILYVNSFTKKSSTFICTIDSGGGCPGEGGVRSHPRSAPGGRQILQRTSSQVLAGALLLASLLTGNAAMAAADLKNPILGKWEVIQPKNESLPLAQTAIAKIEFRENKMIQDGQEHKVTYIIKDKSTVFVKLPVGPVGAPGEKITIRKGKLCRQVSGINGGQMVEYKRRGK